MRSTVLTRIRIQINGMMFSTGRSTSNIILYMIGPFANAGDAVTYIDRTKAVAKTRIVPWLTADKYSFLMISNANMALLLESRM
jgi:hypothetical protein